MPAPVPPAVETGTIGVVGPVTIGVLARDGGGQDTLDGIGHGRAGATVAMEQLQPTVHGVLDGYWVTRPGGR